MVRRSGKVITMAEPLRISDPDQVERVTCIEAYRQYYDLPEDLDDLLYLEVKGHQFRLEGRKIVLVDKPPKFVPDAIVIRYWRAE